MGISTRVLWFSYEAMGGSIKRLYLVRPKISLHDCLWTEKFRGHFSAVGRCRLNTRFWTEFGNGACTFSLDSLAASTPTALRGPLFAKEGCR